MGFFEAQPGASPPIPWWSGAPQSEKTLRVDVDRDPDAAARFWRARHPGAQVGLQIDLPLRLDQKADAVAAADERDRGFGGPQHHDASRRVGDAGKAAGVLLGLGA